MVECGVPEHLQDGVERYLRDGRVPGDFLTAVLCNDLKEAVARADSLSFMGLRGIVSYLYNYVPQSAWGSIKAVEAWTKLSPDARSAIWSARGGLR